MMVTDRKIIRHKLQQSEKGWGATSVSLIGMRNNEVNGYMEKEVRNAIVQQCVDRWCPH